MNVKDSKNSESVKITEISADVHIIGNIAQTTLDLIFENTGNRILEGEFEFPLGENETVSAYALDINGKMRKGVVVEKDKGREVFEAVVRRGIDPGLVEMTAGNNFKTRVYPLPAHGNRHVQITYESNVEKTYTLPVLTNETLKKFSFRISVSDGLAKIDGKKDVLSFKDLNAGNSADFSFENQKMEKPVIIEIPEKYYSSEKIYTQTVGKDTYFYIFAKVPVHKKIEKQLPANLSVYFDVSASAEKRNLQKEFELISLYGKKLLQSKKAVKINVITFSNTIHQQKKFTLKNEGDISEILQYLKEQRFDGATNFDFLENLQKADEVLMLTDGLENWQNKINDSGEHKDKKQNLPKIYTINSSSSADHAFLQKIASDSGAVYINLNSKSTEDSLSELLHENFRLITSEFDGNKISEVYPKNQVISGDSISLSGILNKKSGEIELKFGYGNQVQESLKFTLTAVKSQKNQAGEAKNIQRIWAQMKIAALNASYKENQKEITALAKRFGIVTKDTSLIVLDSVQDYVRYEILPPDDLREEYDKIMNGRQQTKNPEKDDNLNSVYRDFKKFKEWWEKSPEDFLKIHSDSSKTLTSRSEVIMEREFEENYASEESSLSANASEELSEAEALMESPQVSEVNRSQNRSMARSAKSLAPEAATEMESKGLSPEGENESQKPDKKIQLQAWSSDADYISVLKETPEKEMYDKYLELKKEFSNSPAFYMEVSDYFSSEDLNQESLRILSNLAELNLENSDILRALGNKLVEQKQYGLAIKVFEKLVKLRPEIPQFYRDLALAANLAGDKQLAVDTLWLVVTKNWDYRFRESQQIALNDMNSIIALAGKKELDLSKIDKKLIKIFDVDLRIVLTWNTDDCDIDMWVTDSNKEKCYYGHKLTKLGGRMSRDFTQGYGPEEFCIKKADKSSFKIEANYFANHQQKQLQPVIVQAEVYTNFGRKNQKRQVLTLQLDRQKSVFLIGELE